MTHNQIVFSFERCQKALQALALIVNKPATDDRAYIDATIQRFEFTIELFWKLLKKILQNKGVDVVYPKDVIQKAYAGKLINNEELWISMIYDRNMSSHTYNQDLADAIYARIKTYVPELIKQLNALKTYLS
jgi:nucleotidyltransferase substrate binding protein (TIGR01987 family)